MVREHTVRVVVKSLGFFLFLGGFGFTFYAQLSGKQFGWAIWAVVISAIVVGSCLGNATVFYSGKRGSPEGGVSNDADGHVAPGRYDEQIHDRLEAHRKSGERVSRLILTRELVTATGLDLLVARRVIDEFCERHAADMPLTFG